MCRELMKLENQQPPSPVTAVVVPAPSSSSSSSSAALTKRIKATSPSPSYASKRDAQNLSIASVFTSALNGVNHYHHMSSSSCSPSPSKEVAPIAAVQEKWRSEEFLEKVMIKVRRRESHEMALRIVDEITLPSLRVLTNTRINYRAETSLTALLKEWCDHKELLLQQQQEEQQLTLTSSTITVPNTSSSSVASSSTLTPNHDNDFVLSGIIDTWLSEIVIKNVPEMLKNHFESNEIVIKHASREQIAESLANALTEDIYELEILQAKSAYITLRKLRRTKELLNTAKAKKAICNSLPASSSASSYTKEEAEARAAEIESELDQMVKENKKNEIDDHGDRVYEMMATRYGIGSIEDMEAASQGGDRDRDRAAKRAYKDGSIASSLLEEVMSQWDRKHLIGQFSYALMAAFFLFLLVSSVSSSFMAAFFVPHQQSR